MSDDVELESILEELHGIREEMVAETNAQVDRLKRIHPNYRESARNLLHYLTLRRRDLRPLQLKLARLGLSSLGQTEAHVMANLNAVIRILERLSGLAAEAESEETVLDFASGTKRLSEHTEALLGNENPGRGVRIMVTMPSEAAEDYTMIRGLLRQGMDCMRINTAHDDQECWLRMIQHLRRAEESLGRRCRVVMDLAGPKLRTGRLLPGEAVVRIRPVRDGLGKVVAPARVWLCDRDRAASPPSPANGVIPVESSWLRNLKTDDRIRLEDARGSRRNWRVVDVTDHGAWAESKKTSYVTTGTIFCLRRKDSEESDRECVVGELPRRRQSLLLKPGDILVLNRSTTPGRPATFDRSGRLLTPPSIGCSVPEAFAHVRAGESIAFDDGRILGVLERVEQDQIFVRVTMTRPEGDCLREDKGINLPESRVDLPALSAEDLRNLEFVAKHADVVLLSFANRAEDVAFLHQELKRFEETPTAIVVKVETRRAFDNLPEMLFAAMEAPSCGVMIARGDLAVECGFERLAEVQEEILWICESAHVPVIWATQVLETMAKRGMPSRAEITDAAMGHRAECVMLNKGPHIFNALRTLDDILRRMQAHQAKKRSMLRELRLAHSLRGRT